MLCYTNVVTKYFSKFFKKGGNLYFLLSIKDTILLCKKIGGRKKNEFIKINKNYFISSTSIITKHCTS